MIQRILALVAGFLVATMLGDWGHEAHPSGPEQPAAVRAVQALTQDRADAVSAVPADFAGVMGYQPAVVPVPGRGTEPTRADGGCSSPFGGTMFHFGDECKQHDLGYDLLRYANRKGEPLGPWARRAIDDHFDRRMRAGTDRPGGGATAGFYAAVVRFNSWRQGYAVPVREPISAFAVPVGGGLITAVLLGLLPLGRRRLRIPQTALRRLRPVMKRALA